MATSGSFVAGGGYNGKTLLFEWWRNSYDIGANKSNIGWRVSGYGGSGYHTSGNFNFIINGTQVYYSTARISLYSGTVVAEGSIDIYHNNDGSKYFEAYIEAGIYQVAVNTSGSGGWWIDNIPRYANITSFYQSARTLTSITFAYGVDSNIDHLQHRINGGGWIDSNGTITGLSPGTAYNIQIRVKRTDSQLWTESWTVSMSTHQIAQVTGANNFNDEQNPYITFSNASGGQVDVWLEIGGNTTQRCLRTNIPNTGNYTWALTSDERELLGSLMPNNNSITARYVIRTANNGNYLHWLDRTLSIVNANPVFNDFTYQDINTAITALTGNNQIIVKGYSNIKTTVSTANKAIAQKSATMSRYKTFIGSQSVEANYSDSANVEMTINSADNENIVVSAIDSRGNQTNITKTASIKNYVIPVVQAFSVYRENGTGNKVFFELNGTYWADTFGAVANTIQQVQYRYKKRIDTEYSNWIRIDDKFNINSNGTFENKEDDTNFFVTTDNGGTYTNFDNVEYDIQIRVIDRIVTTLEITVGLNSGIPGLDRIKNYDGYYSYAINQMADSNYALAVKGKISADNILDYDVISTW